MRNLFLFLTACLLAAGAPFLPKHSNVKTTDILFPGWPTHFKGQVLTEWPLSEGEQYFNSGFPGQIAKLTDGERVFIIRWVTQATRKLHSARDCFKAVGYQVQNLPQYIDHEGQQWGYLKAVKNGETAWIYERIVDNAGKSWNMVSAWYWNALAGNTVAPWWAITIVEFREVL